jgi:hypothetical protein
MTPLALARSPLRDLFKKRGLTVDAKRRATSLYSPLRTEQVRDEVLRTLPRLGITVTEESPFRMACEAHG